MFFTSLAGCLVGLLIFCVAEVVLDLFCDLVRVPATRRPWVRAAFGAGLLACCLLSSCAPGRQAARADVATTHLDSAQLAALILPRSTAAEECVPPTPLHAFFGRSTARKDKRRVSITVYNAPAKVKGSSTAVVGDGNVTADNRKARGPVAVGDSSSATDNTKAGSRGGAAALGPHSQATAVTEDAGTSWWAWLLVFLAGVVAGGVAVLILIVRKLRP